MSATTETHPLNHLQTPSAPADSRPRTKSHADLDRHNRKCAICNHPEREQIEDDFLRWCDPWHIVTSYELPSRSCLYRHVEAHGLLLRRRRNLRGVAERILENVDSATITANSVLHAMRLFAHITEDGEWIEPPKRAIVTHVHSYPGGSAPVAPPEPAPPPPTPSNGAQSKSPCSPPSAPQTPADDSFVLSDPARKELKAMLRGIDTRRKNPREEAARLKLLNESLAFLALIHRNSPPADSRPPASAASVRDVSVGNVPARDVPPGDSGLLDSARPREILKGDDRSHLDRSHSPSGAYFAGGLKEGEEFLYRHSGMADQGA